MINGSLIRQICLLCVTVALLHGVTATRAKADSATLTISPPVVEIMLAPNKSLNQTFNLEYEGAELGLIPELHLVKPSDSEGHVTIDPSPLDESSIPLVIKPTSFEFGEIVKSSGSKLALSLTFESASVDIATDIYLALVVRPASTVVADTATTPAVSALILVTINPSGVTPIDLEIEDFDVAMIHDSWNTLTLNPTLKNNLPIMIRPEGKYEIVGPTNQTVYTTDLYPNLLLGESSRLLQGSVLCNANTQRTDPCDPTLLSWSPKWSDLGPHRLRLTITTQGGTKLTETERVIWLLPLRIILIAGSILLIILTFVVIKSRRPQPTIYP